jgi:sec-independent protein translocase protein TatB
MEILGVGAPELLFIIIIAIIVLGPRDMQKAGRTIGRFLNKLVHSEGWRVFQKTSAEMRNLPTRLMREANLDMQETDKEIRKALDMQKTDREIRNALDVRQKPAVSPSRRNLTPSNEGENMIQPPTVDPAPMPDSDPDPDKHD